MKIEIKKLPSVYIGRVVKFEWGEVRAQVRDVFGSDAILVDSYCLEFTPAKDNDVPTMEQYPMYGRKER